MVKGYRKYVKVVILVLISIVMVACGGSMDDGGSKDVKEDKVESEVTGQLEVHYIDVGQADATLLVDKSGSEDKVILYDAGDWTGDEVVPYLKEVGIEKIDVMVGTHPHADHIGQMEDVIDNFEVSEVWMSGDIATTNVFEKVLIAIDENVEGYEEPRAGDKFEIGNMDIEIISPSEVTGELNDGSVAMRMVYGDVSFVFTGDAEVNAEEGMLSRDLTLSADILHLGHHGSDTSTTDAFLEEVSPKVAIYSAGEGNSYGHPSASTVNKVNNKGIDLYGTDVHGNILIETDGKEYNITTDVNGNIETETKEVVEDVHEKVEKEEDDVKSNVVEEDKGEQGDCVDINEASKEELMRIIHIGDARADEIIIKRPFSSTDDLNRVEGIAEGRLGDIKEEGIACTK